MMEEKETEHDRNINLGDFATYFDAFVKVPRD